ncbi:TSUP family transporter [Pseudomonas chlororaphis]|nr:TSUP family transporter [Pseudomonas chlororaphis]
MILILIAIISVVQSLFGVGLLLFGTPILLFVGYTFPAALSILLPASLTISVLQLMVDKSVGRAHLWSFMLFGLPFLALGLIANLSGVLKLNIEVMVALLLILSGALRLFSGPKRWLSVLFAKHANVALATTGLLHGLTNMGGSLLSIYCSSAFEEKKLVRQHIALGYACFAATQLIILAATGALELSLTQLYAACLAALVYLFCGQTLFRRVNSAGYNLLFSAFMVACAGLMLSKKYLF